MSETESAPRMVVPRTPKVAPVEGTKRSTVPADEIIIDVERLDFNYGATRALHGISLQIPKRKVTAFIGPSGCGKSTLLRCLNRMNDLIDNAKVTAGTIRIEG